MARSFGILLMNSLAAVDVGSSFLWMSEYELIFASLGLSDLTQPESGNVVTLIFGGM
ncbi:hypothetical protein SynA1528_00524 [Synechococcus sp. A15-28]|nr:hypothetical protein SynA1528_00524 [Synechococcus sp. A15-28]